MNEEIIAKNIKEIIAGVSESAGAAGRRAEDVELVVVSKNRTEEELLAAIRGGARHIGENRVQEAEKKRGSIPEEVTFRLIGHLQRNKAAKAIEIFDSVDSVDSIRLAGKLSGELEKINGNMPVLVQINSSGEDTKSGFEPEEAEGALEEIEQMTGLEVKGLMTIGPLTVDESRIRRAFETTRELFERLKAGRDGFDVLSMGMTSDYRIAVEEGSTMIRVGRAVFEGA